MEGSQIGYLPVSFLSSMWSPTTYYQFLGLSSTHNLSVGGSHSCNARRCKLRTLLRYSEEKYVKFVHISSMISFRGPTGWMRRSHDFLIKRKSRKLPISKPNTWIERHSCHIILEIRTIFWVVSHFFSPNKSFYLWSLCTIIKCYKIPWAYKHRPESHPSTVL